MGATLSSVASSSEQNEFPNTNMGGTLSTDTSSRRNMGEDQTVRYCTCCSHRIPSALPSPASTTPPSNAVSATSLNTPDPSPTFRFLDLPPELRCVIYEYLLVVGRVFLLPQHHGDPRAHDNELYHITQSERYYRKHLYRKPQVQLLRVCKKIHSEVEPMYLAKNLFILPIGWHTREPFASTDRLTNYNPKKQHLFSKAALKHLKNVSFAFDMRDVSVCAPSHWHWTNSIPVFGVPLPPFSMLTPRERMQEAHDYAVDRICSAEGWKQVTRILSHFASHSNALQYVELDFTNTYCPTGCCRLVGFVSFCWVQALQPKTISILGIHTNEEKTKILDSMDSMDFYHSHNFFEENGLVFRGKYGSDPWSKWEENEHASSGRASIYFPGPIGPMI